jgi:hypothetical protein
MLVPFFLPYDAQALGIREYSTQKGTLVMEPDFPLQHSKGLATRSSPNELNPVNILTVRICRRFYFGTFRGHLVK